ncbi:MAG: hypothetical protein ABI687_11525 [Flavitalea sp.]
MNLFLPRILSGLLFFALMPRVFAQPVTIRQATVFQDKTALTKTDMAAAEILTQETFKRTGLSWPVSAAFPSAGDVIILRRASSKIKIPVAFETTPSLPQRSESFRIVSTVYQNRTIILIEGIDERGLIFGVGQALRMMEYAAGSISFNQAPMLASSPDKPIRGHQLGYRNTANSYDGWTKRQFEQYIRDLAIFGANSIESIPIFDEHPSPHFKVAPMEMNSFISATCQKYGMEYWMWIPAQFDLKDQGLRNKYLSTVEEICKQSVRIDGVFFPGGDPGDNSPELVMPLLQDIAVLLKKYHPSAKTWLSLQGFTPAQCQYVYQYIKQKMPDYLGGLITGPSSPTAAETRPLLPAKYKIRHYPDLTHNVRCEFEIPWWDPAFSLTLGREAVNPRPYHYAAIYRAMEPYIDGFISYSDGVHDDVNKIIWTALSWNKNAAERDILKEYSNYFFSSPVAAEAADGILALEKNWQGPIVSNGGITATLAAWKELEKKYSSLDTNWRWQMNLLRAYYDAYTRSRLIYETRLEKEVNQQLQRAVETGADSAIRAATRILSYAENAPVSVDDHSRIIALCEALYKSICLQTSVAKYQASGLERGAVLDFLDRPLNNKWWLEDEFKKLSDLKEAEKIKALQVIANWENPGPGGFYDEVGNVSNSVHEMKGESWIMDPMMHKSLNPGYDFSDNGMSRKRLSWLTSMRWPISMEYTVIDTAASYTVRITGVGESLLKINGQRVAPSHYERAQGAIKEFPVPEPMVKQGKLTLTWDDLNEDFLNWRKQSRVSEVWLIKNAE